MEYTVQALAKLAGISARTLRHYDEIGILKPARINSSGYRIYGKTEVDRLQQILFYRELGMKLENIRSIISEPSFNSVVALKEHNQKLLAKRRQLDILINNVNKTILSLEGRIKMSDKEKFEGFKQKMLNDNEQKYGAEIRQKYGDDVVDESNKKLMGLTEAEYGEWEKLGIEVMDTLKAAFATGNPAGELAQKVADLHRQWLSYSWTSYTKEAHAAIAEMYVNDERFTAYYDNEQPGVAKFLRDAILIYVSGDSSAEHK